MHKLDFSESFFHSSTNQINSHKSSIEKPILIGAKAFIYEAKEGSVFAIYVAPISEKAKTSSGIPSQYQDYQDIFEKKNADILPEHRSYDCSIDLKEGTQPPFGPIYSLSQDELTELKTYIE